MQACPCYESMRDLSRNGFTISVRPAADTIRDAGPSWVCVGCDTRYAIQSARRLVAA
jgi:hypothetical protein